MKNKVLATLLAVCLFAGLAVPAFAMSSQSGVDEDIKTLEFVEKTYTIKKGDNKDLGKEIRAFASSKQLVQEPNITWAVENDSKYAFDINDATGVVSASEETGSATVIATAKDGTVKATVKVVAAKNTFVAATGYNFKASTATLLSGRDAKAGEGDTIKIVPTPKDAKFSAGQRAAIETAVLNGSMVLTVQDGKKVTLATLTPTVTSNEDEVVITYAVEDIATPRVADTVTITFTSNAGTVTAGTVQGIQLVAKIAASGSTPAADAVVLKPTTAVATGDTPAQIAAKYAGQTIKLGGVVYDATATAGVVTLTAKQTGVKAYTLDTTVVAIPGVPTTTVAVAAGTAGAEALNTLPVIKVPTDAVAKEISVAFPRYDDTGSPATIKRTVRVNTKLAVPSTRINAAGGITIEVGEKYSMKKQFKQGPSDANIFATVAYGLEAADQNSDAVDYADFTNTNKDDISEIIGVKVGSNKVSATIPGQATPVTVLVTVVEKGTKPAAGGNTTLLSAVQLNLGVGDTSQIVVKTAEGGKVDYSSYFKDIATVDAAGKITAVKEGTVKIKVVEEGKEPAYVTVKVGATTTKPSDKPTDVPQTAVVALAPLF